MRRVGRLSEWSLKSPASFPRMVLDLPLRQRRIGRPWLISYPPSRPRPSTGTRREGNRIWHTIVALARQAETNVVERSGGHFVQIGKSLKSWTRPIRRLHQNGCDVEGGRSRPRSFFHLDRLGRKAGSRSRGRDSAAGDKNERDDMKEEETLHWCSLIPS